jgi:hypothetical protein
MDSTLIPEIEALRLFPKSKEAARKFLAVDSAIYQTTDASKGQKVLHQTRQEAQ